MPRSRYSRRACAVRVARKFYVHVPYSRICVVRKLRGFKNFLIRNFNLEVGQNVTVNQQVVALVQDRGLKGSQIATGNLL